MNTLNCHWTVHLKVDKMVSFMLHIFYQNKKVNKFLIIVFTYNLHILFIYMLHIYGVTVYSLDYTRY